MADSIASQFSIYNFFSVLLPGLLFLIGLFPLLPEDIDISGIGMILPILAIAFATGQLLHILAVGIQRYLRLTSHRDQFANELESPSELSPATINAFYQACRSEFPNIGLTGCRVNDAKNDVLVDSIYVRVRAHMDMEPGGRSQIFQAIYAFCRSMYFMAVILGLMYIGYGLTIWNRPDSPLPYPSKLGTYEFEYITIWVVAMFLSTTTYYLFQRGTVGYRDYFIQYLIMEFLLSIDDRDGSDLGADHSGGGTPDAE